MVRTQIYLPEEQYKRLNQIAKRENISMAQVIRIYIKTGLRKEEVVDKSGREAILSLIGIGTGKGPKDLSTNHDYYLYGGPKKKK